MKVCIEPGCPELSDKTRCAEHERANDKARGSRQERGYDADYDAARQRRPYVSATHCETCGQRFTRDNPKTAGHVKDIREHGPNSAGIFPQCRTCNYGWRRARPEKATHPDAPAIGEKPG